MTVTLTLLSVFWINRHTEFDGSGFYFFGAYGMGALVYWAKTTSWGRRVYWATCACVVFALGWDWRLRLFVAFLTAMILWAALDWSGPGERMTRLFNRLNESTYLFFLLNFPMLIAANVLWVFRSVVGIADCAWVLFLFWVLTLVLADFLQTNMKWLSVIKSNK